MSILHFRRIERRRTTRASLTMNVLAYGERADGGKFKFWTKTTSVAGHGGVIEMEEKLTAGQLFEVFNEHNMKKAVARVVAIRELRDGKILGAFEFVERGDNFWSMVFPTPGAKPMRRFVSKPGASGKN